ncbi:hypothetical protein B296_00017192, partial [Ensete ventricosum]
MMGPLAMLTKWISEDDFLLKNAVEVSTTLAASFPCQFVCLYAYHVSTRNKKEGEEKGAMEEQRGKKEEEEERRKKRSAVVAGASLESLAKGAVCFSRRFTLHELQDRWYSLLYDSGTSAEASARMIEFEIEVSTSNPSKGNRNCNLKGKYSVS